MGVAEFGEGQIILLVVNIFHLLIALGRVGSHEAQVTVVVVAHHVDVDVVVPRYEAVVARRTQHGAIGGVVLEVVGLAERYEGLEGLEGHGFSLRQLFFG